MEKNGETREKKNMGNMETMLKNHGEMLNVPIKVDPSHEDQQNCWLENVLPYLVRATRIDAHLWNGCHISLSLCVLMRQFHAVSC